MMPAPTEEKHFLKSDKAATLQDVANLAGVTKMTVSNVLRGKGRVSETTRQAVRQAMQQLHYMPNPLAQRLSSGRAANQIDLYALNLDDGVGLQKLKLIQNGLMVRGFDVPIHSHDFHGAHNGAPDRKVELMRKLRRSCPRAVVCATTGVDDAVLGELESYLREGGQAVCYDEEVALACDQVVFDVEHGIGNAARQLLELGHRRLGLFEQGRSEPRAAIRRGFERALREFDSGAGQAQYFGSALAAEEAGAELARSFLRLKVSERPTGMIVINDRAAFTFMVEVARSGVLVPRDLSVIGHDDLPVAKFCPTPLTSISYPVEDIASHVVELLLSRIEGEYSGAARRKVVVGELAQRQSTANLSAVSL
jgi:DNA-binding LacI/PurR family transcriptional regulator